MRKMMVGVAKAVERDAKITMPTLSHRHQTQQFFRRSKSQQRDYFQHAIVTARVAAKKMINPLRSSPPARH